jgi:hypothetical protein
MTTVTVTQQASLPKPKVETAEKRKRYAGKVVYMYAFDVAYEMLGEPPTELMGQKLEPFTFGPSKRSPRHMAFYRPQMVKLPPVQRVGPHGPVSVERSVKLLPVGAISITVHVPFSVDKVEDLVIYHDLHLDAGLLNHEARQLAEDVRRELDPYYFRAVDKLADEEAYTVFCLEAPLTTSEGLPISAENWLQAHRRQVAALLTQESDITNLSRQETEENTVRYLSYYQNDLVVIDWDAALVVDEKSDFDETLYVMELANLQLAEFEAYDRLLDEALDRAYRDLVQRSPGWPRSLRRGDGPVRTRAHTMRELKEIRIDLARLSDELSNSMKFFGDWHFARVYRTIAERFHLADWHHTIDEKLGTLNELYEILKHDQSNRWMLILEATIVLLFIIDLIVLFVGLKGV